MPPTLSVDITPGQSKKIITPFLFFSISIEEKNSERLLVSINIENHRADIVNMRDYYCK